MKAASVLIGLSAALALSACSKSAQEPEPVASTPSAQASQVVVPSASAEPELVEPMPTHSAEPSPEPTASRPVSANEIPAAIRGRWGLVPKDCASKLGDAKGLLTVSAGQLKFYESVAKLGKVKEAGDSRVRATFSFSGEGMTWTQDVVLDTQNGGKTLIRRDYGQDAQPGPLKYTRCA